MIDYAFNFSIWTLFMYLTKGCIQSKKGGKGLPRSRSRGRSAGANLNKLIPALPNWGSMFFGVLVGIFATSLVVFTFATSDITLRIPTSSAKKAHTVAKSASQSSETTPARLAKATDEPTTLSEPRFDFYTELTKNAAENQPTIVSKAVGPSLATNKPATLDLKSTPKAINGYLVQAGHFRKGSDADAIRAKLALNGFETKVVAAKERDGEMWHRIMLGPVKTELQAKELQKKLKNLEVESILVLKYN
jgi:cell division protein FtsN